MGRCTVGEHVWRVSGSRHLAALDVPTPIIMRLARWGSDVILRYIADAPLSALTRVYLDRLHLSNAALKAMVPPAPSPACSTAASAVQHTSSHDSCAAELSQSLLDGSLPDVGVSDTCFVRLTADGRVHLVWSEWPVFQTPDAAVATLCNRPVAPTAERFPAWQDAEAVCRDCRRLLAHTLADSN